jgi:hypothetical protein
VTCFGSSAARPTCPFRFISFHFTPFHSIPFTQRACHPHGRISCAFAFICRWKPSHRHNFTYSQFTHAHQAHACAKDVPLEVHPVARGWLRQARARPPLLFRVQIMDIVSLPSLPSLVGAVLTILVIHRVYLRYQDYQVNTP